MKQATGIDIHEIHRGSPYAACQTAREAAMAPHHTFALFFIILSMTAAIGFGNDLEPVDGVISSEVTAEVVGVRADEARDVPRISGTLYPRIHNKLQQAFPVAVDHVRSNPECRDLFAKFGADGLEKLSTSLYYPSTVQMERRYCRGGVAAFTFVKSPQVRLCKGFASLRTEKAAAVLVHEALHFAGLSERTIDPRGLDPSKINSMVKKACGF
jgi:hypothetical protein